MGEVTAREHFGLREMLYQEVQRIGEVKFLPAQCRYAVKHGDMPVKVIRISYYDFKKVMRRTAIGKLIDLYEIDYQTMAKDSHTVQVKDENKVKNFTTVTEDELVKKL